MFCAYPHYHHKKKLRTSHLDNISLSQTQMYCLGIYGFCEDSLIKKDSKSWFLGNCSNWIKRGWYHLILTVSVTYLLLCFYESALSVAWNNFLSVRKEKKKSFKQNFIAVLYFLFDDHIHTELIVWLLIVRTAFFQYVLKCNWKTIQMQMNADEWLCIMWSN